MTTVLAPVTGLSTPDQVREMRDMVEMSRTFRITLRLETNSGSVYYLTPVDDIDWRITRFGVGDKGETRHLGSIAFKGEDLRIGPWYTTGLCRLSLL